MDVIEDLRGKSAVAMVASSSGISSTTMRFSNPQLVSGNDYFFQAQFAAGWSAPDYDGDTTSIANCATMYSGVTQHYSDCWAVNLGSDAEVVNSSRADGSVGPHMYGPTIDALGLVRDGSLYSRVRRVSRFVKS
jgi:hypothetical protein